MSLQELFANKPWMRPIQYTSEADSSHGQSERGLVRDTDPETGEISGGRDHYSPTEFGDGRPSASTRDDTPMIYNQPKPGAVIDIDDHDELDGPAPACDPRQPYAAQGGLGVPGIQPMIVPANPTPKELARDMPTPRPQQPKPDPRQPTATQADGNWPRVSPELVSVTPSVFGPIARISIGPAGFAATADNLEQAATTFQAWAKMLRAL